MPFEIGERVTYRSLEWEVSDNASEAVITLYGRSHENQGRTIRVIPGIEPIERTATPEVAWTLGQAGYDHTAWKALHDAFRLTLAHGRGHLASVDWGRLILEPYQLVPLQRIERLPFPRLLIADDTGLGKTAEAGLILFRLLQRRRADRVLILTRARPEPERWQRELREKFGLEFDVINSAQDYGRLRREVPAHLNVFGDRSRLIMSMHFAAQKHIVDDLRRDLRWDVVIIDEAHHLAERGTSTKRLTELARVVADRCEALLLLTATPHDGKGESFASLLRLLDPYAVVDPDRLDQTIVRPLIVRRLKTHVQKADGSHFIPREITVIDIEDRRSRAERSLAKGVRDYTTLLRKQATELEARGERNRAMGVSFLESFLRKRLASSSYACQQSLLNRHKRLVEGEPNAAAADDAPEDVRQPELQVEPVLLPNGQSEIAILADLIARAQKIPLGEEAKVKALLDLLGRLGDAKVIVFTEFRDTLTMLEQVLDAAGYAEAYVSYHGDTSAADREMIRRRFLEDRAVRIFLGTDAASEGINLQQGCNHLVHLEIPWNPNRYEQRNGRIDRYGQRVAPQIFLLVAMRSLEDRVARVVVEKLELIGKQLGSVSNVFPIASRVSIDEFLRRADATDAEEPDVEGFAREAAALLDSGREELLAELRDQVPAELLRGNDFGQTEEAAITQELERSRAFVPAYRDVQSFLEYFFRVEHGRLDPTGTAGVYQVVVPQRLRKELGGRERYLRATFDRQLAVAEGDLTDDQRVEFLSPGHPLVRAALRQMRGQIYAAGFTSRLSYRKVPVGQPDGYCFTYALRFVDGRGETIEERFEAVFVGLDGLVSGDSEADLRYFAAPPRPVHPNLTAAEQSGRLPAFKAGFEAAHAAASQEITRRSRERAAQLAQQQSQIADEALQRLGVWLNASENRLANRVVDALGTNFQYRFDGGEDYQRQVRERERKTRQFERERHELYAQRDSRIHEIRALREVRGDSIDPIGALLVIAEREA